MKSYFAAFCIAISWSTGCFSQSLAESGLLLQLKNQDVKALDAVLEKPETYSALVLYSGAGFAFKEKRLEDSGFLFYAGQLRSRFDQKCFPPKGTGAENPFLVFGSLSQTLGSTINPAVMSDPETFAKVIERLEKWNPKAPEDYTPGYEFKERLTEEQAHDAAKPNRTEFLSRMGDLSKLLSDTDYFAAFRIVQAYNLASPNKRPSKEENEKATEAMKRIEKEKGLKGFLTK